MSEGSTTEIDSSLFKLIEPNAIDHVIIEKEEVKTELKYSGTQWKLNNIYEADRNLVDVLFATIAQATPKRMAAKSIRDSVVNQILKTGIKISFNSGGQTQKQFYVSGDGSTVTYFMAEDKIPYVMVIPGYKVYVGGIFEQDANAWRDKRIFNFNWRNFKELSAEFPADPKQKFSVAMTGKYFSIADGVNTDTASLNNYLDAVSLITADGFYKVGESAETDSISQSKPIMSITVKDVANQTYNLQIFEIKKDNRNVLGKWNDDFAWFNRRNILPLYKKRKEFVRNN